MSIKRVMRQNRTILIVPLVDINGVPNIVSGTQAAPVLTPFTTPTAASLNTWASIVTANAGAVGGNISQATLDSVKLGLGASTTDNTLLITSIGNEVSPKFVKVIATFEFMRDQDPTANGVFNMAWQLIRVPDIRYAIVDRVLGGKKSTAAFAVGDVVSLYIVNTDNGTDTIGDQKYVTATQDFVPTGVVNPNYTIAA